MKSLVCKFALKFYQHDNSLSWSECMKLAWIKAKLVFALRSGCQLTFAKVSTGEVVTRLASSIVSGEYEESRNDRKQNPYCVPFVDKSIEQIRSLNIQYLIKVS